MEKEILTLEIIRNDAKRHFHSAKLDEDFYVASVGEVKNIMIYSKKLFELKQ